MVSLTKKSEYESDDWEYCHKTDCKAARVIVYKTPLWFQRSNTNEYISESIDEITPSDIPTSRKRFQVPVAFALSVILSQSLKQLDIFFCLV